MKKLAYFLFLILLFTLCGCETELDVNLFATDVKDVAVKKRSLLAETIIRVQIPSEDRLDELQTRILTIIRRYFDAKDQKLQYESRGFTSFAKAIVGVTVTKPQDRGKKSVIWLSAAQTSEGFIDLDLKVDRAGFEAFSEDVKNEFMEKVRAEDLAIIVRLQNDGRDPIKVRVSSSWVNGQPNPLQKTFEIGRRKSITIKLSKIATADALEKGSFPFVALVGDEPTGSEDEPEPPEPEETPEDVKAPKPPKPAEENRESGDDENKEKGPKDILKKYFNKD